MLGILLCIFPIMKKKVTHVLDIFPIIRLPWRVRLWVWTLRVTSVDRHELSMDWTNQTQVLPNFEACLQGQGLLETPWDKPGHVLHLWVKPEKGSRSVDVNQLLTNIIVLTTYLVRYTSVLRGHTAGYFVDMTNNLSEMTALEESLSCYVVTQETFHTIKDLYCCTAAYRSNPI